MEEALCTFARLDAFVSMTIFCLRLMGLKRCKTLTKTLPYHFLSIGYCCIRSACSNFGAFAEKWCPDELYVSGFSIKGNEITAITPLQPNDTLYVFVPSRKICLIDVSSQWFNRYITTVMGTIYDYYIQGYVKIAKNSFS